MAVAVLTVMLAACEDFDSPDSNVIWQPGHPTPAMREFHSGHALQREKIVYLDSMEDSTVEAPASRHEEMACDQFVICDESDARRNFSDEFLEAHPEFLNCGNGGAKIVVLRYETTRNNGHLQLNFIEKLKNCVSVDLSYFHFSQNETVSPYTQIVAVWTSSEEVTGSTVIVGHVHVERRY